MAEECLAGVPAGAGEEAGSVWRVPLRINRNTRHFEVRLGPPGGDKVVATVLYVDLFKAHELLRLAHGLRLFPHLGLDEFLLVFMQLNFDFAIII